MDTKEIGSYIANKRKAKGLTQRELGEMLSLTDKTISRWETGNYMPDISYLIPLSEILDVTVEELLSGRDIGDKKESNVMIRDVIYCLSNKIKNERFSINLIIIAAGLMITLISMMAVRRDISWLFILVLTGLFIASTGIYRIIDKSFLKKFVISFMVFGMGLGILLSYDKYAVRNNHKLPLFAYEVSVYDYMKVYETPFYRLYQINPDTSSEYFIFDDSKSMKEDDVIIVPFDYDKSGYGSISRYHSQYLGDNSNTANLVSKLPLNEYGSGIMINPDSCTLHIEYKISLLYIDEYYLKECLIYNSVSMFLMIENLEGIEYSIVGKTFKVNREDVIQYYSDYYKIKDKDSFEEYLAGKLDDAAFINDMFDCLISLS